MEYIVKILCQNTGFWAPFFPCTNKKTRIYVENACKKYRFCEEISYDCQNTFYVKNRDILTAIKSFFFTKPVFLHDCAILLVDSRIFWGVKNGAQNLVNILIQYFAHPEVKYLHTWMREKRSPFFRTNDFRRRKRRRRGTKRCCGGACSRCLCRCGCRCRGLRRCGCRGLRRCGCGGFRCSAGETNCIFCRDTV